MKLSYIIEDISGKIRFLTQKIDKFYIDKNRGRSPLPLNMSLSKLARQNNLSNASKIAEFIVSLDPTNNGTYANWISDRIINGEIRIPEDTERLQQTILIFNKFKNNKVITQKDINQYKFRELEQLCNKLVNQSEDNTPSTINQWNKWVLHQGAKKIFDDGVMEIIKFEKTGNEINVFPSKIINNLVGDSLDTNWLPETIGPRNLYQEYITEHPNTFTTLVSVDLAAMALSRWTIGTSYCVANPRTGNDHYIKFGRPVYALISNKQHQLLIHKSQIKNTKDEQITISGLKTSIFLAKMIDNLGDTLDEETITTIKIILENSLEHYSDLYNVKPNIKQFITSVLEKYKEESI